MNIIISNSSSIPIYEQIKNSIIKDILENNLKPDESIPSIRQLAADLKISIMTVKKAYDELEKDGYIITRQGKGSFIASQNNELIKEQVLITIEQSLEKAISLAKKNNLTYEELTEILKILYRSV